MKDRLLTEEYIENQMGIAFKGFNEETGELEWFYITMGDIKELLKAQDAKTAKLVAEEIFEELEQVFPWIWQGTNAKPWQALKDKYLKEKGSGGRDASDWGLFH